MVMLFIITLLLLVTGKIKHLLQKLHFESIERIDSPQYISTTGVIVASGLLKTPD